MSIVLCKVFKRYHSKMLEYTLALLFIVHFATAQPSKWTLGGTASVDAFRFQKRENNLVMIVSQTPQPFFKTGFTLGVVAQRHTALPYLSLETGVRYVHRFWQEQGQMWVILPFTISPSQELSETTVSYSNIDRFHFLELPALARGHLGKFSLLLGPTVYFTLHYKGRYKSSSTNNAQPDEARDIIVYYQAQPLVVNLTAGAGYQMRLSTKTQLEVRGTYGRMFTPLYQQDIRVISTIEETEASMSADRLRLTTFQLGCVLSRVQ